jgi:hypothetical protein
MESKRCADPLFAARVVDIEASYDGWSSQWVFTDQGAGFDVERILSQLDSEPDPQRPSGRGLFLIRAFVDEMRYDDYGRRLTLTLHRGTEKRAHQRLPIARGVRVTPIDNQGRIHEEASYTALARDLSTEGIGLLQAHLSESKRVLVTIPTAAGEPISLPAEVRHWQQVGDTVEVGCRFEPRPPSPLSPARSDPVTETLGRLVDRLGEQLKPREERRKTPRYPYTEAISIERADRTVLRGFGRDLSRCGIGFFTTTALPLDVIGVSLPASATGPAITLRAVVVRCNRLTDGFYDVAARFLSA